MRTFFKSVVMVVIGGFVFNSELARAVESDSQSVEKTAAVSAAAVPSKWNASFNSYLYDFEGKVEDKHSNYGFGDVKLKLQMFSLSYQLNSETTLLANLPYIENEVLTYFFKAPYKDYTRGLSDLSLSANHFVGIYSGIMVMADLGLSLPTGGISEKNVNNPSLNYVYNMQLGSGTLDPIAGITAMKLGQNYTLGSHVMGIFRTGQNNLNDYHLGNQYRLDAWADYNLNSIFQARLVGYHKTKEAISGQDKTIGRNALVEFYHHNQMNWDLSAAIAAKQAVNKNISLAAEFGVPLAQGSQNWDDVEVITQYYGKLSVSGVF